jgi:REP element-mobilizing transposase RayT
MEDSKIYLFVHIIIEVAGRATLLKKSFRQLLFAWSKKTLVENDIQVIRMNGGEDHIHIIVEMLPTQQLMQIGRQIKESTAEFINASKMISSDFAWQETYTAFTVSPGNLQQTIDFIDRQEEYHLTRTLEQELSSFNKTIIHWHETP